MALMKFREANHVLRVGVRPGHDGTQIYYHVLANLIGRTALMPVHASLTRYITYYYMSTTPNNALNAELELRNAVPATVWWICYARSRVGYLGQTISGSFWPPLEVPSDWTIDVNLSAAQAVTVGILGWEE